MATLLTYKTTVQMRRHGSELNAENAIGATNNYLSHISS
jgi:hypothetical protein